MYRLPIINQMLNLSGFELVAVIFFIIIGFFCSGFLLDYLMKKQGFGPYLNGVLALIGAYFGMVFRWAAFPLQSPYEPLLSMALVMASILLLVLGLAALRNRIA